VEWKYTPTAMDAITECKVKSEKCKVVAVEQDRRSKLFYTVRYELPLAIVVGNETHGVSKDVLDKADMIVEMPMWGINKSLNVMVSCGIILYTIMEKCVSRAKSGAK
jgi:tRNA G18 (ribose-2'-O)-methylase SpoU